MKVVILCGGMGTRLGQGLSVPKPLVEIGGRPILWHVMKTYAAFGFREFILCLGFGGPLIRARFRKRRSFFPSGWKIRCVDTGLTTHTGGRVKRIEPLLQEEAFFLTYADGVADIDLRHLLRFHQRHGRIGTVTAVRPASPFGEMAVNSRGLVTRFTEKPRMSHWINGGFFIFNRAFFRYLKADSILERQPLEKLAADRQMCAFKHAGFWRCLDTYKDTLVLNELCKKGSPPWAASGKTGRF